jgi:hypothetical protein
LTELQALACEDCPARVTVQRGRGIAGPVLVVVVEHHRTCPWAGRFVPVAGATVTRPGALLRHIREGEPVVPGLDAGDDLEPMEPPC